MPGRLLKSEIYKFFPLLLLSRSNNKGYSLELEWIQKKRIAVVHYHDDYIKQGRTAKMDFQVARVEKIKVTGRKSRVETSGGDMLLKTLPSAFAFSIVYGLAMIIIFMTIENAIRAGEDFVPMSFADIFGSSELGANSFK